MKQQSYPRVNPIITGVTGMIGEGVLHECLNHELVDRILVLGRRPSGMSHPKLKEVITPDLSDLSSVKDEIQGYNACYFCAGVSSIGKNEEEYTRLTYDLTLGAAKSLLEVNPGMAFCYVSGMGTDSSEQGKLMWARVKGRTENALAKMPFGAVYNFRPGIIQPIKGLKNTLKAYKYLGWLMPVFSLFSKNAVVKLSDIGTAMINSVLYSYPKQILEPGDIKQCAKQPVK